MDSDACWTAAAWHASPRDPPGRFHCRLLLLCFSAKAARDRRRPLPHNPLARHNLPRCAAHNVASCAPRTVVPPGRLSEVDQRVAEWGQRIGLAQHLARAQDQGPAPPATPASRPSRRRIKIEFKFGERARRRGRRRAARQPAAPADAQGFTAQAPAPGQPRTPAASRAMDRRRSRSRSRSIQSNHDSTDLVAAQRASPRARVARRRLTPNPTASQVQCAHAPAASPSELLKPSGRACRSVLARRYFRPRRPRPSEL